MARVWIVNLVAAAAAVAAGCPATGSYQCDTEADCGTGGACVEAGDGRSYCAFPSEACGGGLEFAGSAGGGHAGACVGGAMIDAAPPPPPPAPVAACFVGEALARVEGACTARVCDVLGSCCQASWSRQCVLIAERECDVACGGRVAWATTGAIDVRDFTRVGDVLVDTPLPAYGVPAQFYRAVYFADFDRDDRVELVINTGNGNTGGDEQLLLRERLAPAGWDVARDLRPIGAPNYEGFEAAAGDWDRDDQLDLAVMGTYPGAVAFRGSATASLLVTGPALPAAIDNYLGGAIDLGDYDRDGADDLVVFDYTSGGGLVLRWTGAAFEVATTLGPFSTPRRVSFGDLDRDGDLDLAVADSGEARVLRNDAGSFVEVWSFALAGSDFCDAAWIDIDQNGWLDLVLGDGQNAGGRLRMFRNVDNATGDLVDEAFFTSDELDNVWKLAIGDIDGDGDPDVAVASERTPNRIYLNEPGPNGARALTVGWTAPSVRPTFGVALTRPR